MNQVKANSIPLELGYGRFSLIDFGSLINSEPLVVDKSKARVYSISGLDDDEAKSIIAIQGLSKTGETDLTVDTQAGIYQIHLKLNPGQGKDLMLGQRSRSRIITKKFTLSKSRSTIVKLDSHINQYILAANPELVSYNNIKDYYETDFLKVFALVSKDQTGTTDIVVPTRTGVYKFSIEITGENNDHNSFIDFSSASSLRL
ncbi:MAG: hypothetical protein HOA17_03685 [Candidatus Melainabacteria bacterium]|nr:hypothetical protein [Candidatus Melainabacteria bacterium]